jgi:dienelactone hydrolase
VPRGEIVTVAFAAYGATRVRATYPAEATREGATAKFPVVVWFAGAHNGCDHADNAETLTHLASHGFIALCPMLFVEPYVGDERDVLDVARWVRRANEDEDGRFRGRVGGVAAVGYSLGGGRVIRAMETAERDAAGGLFAAPDESKRASSLFDAAVTLQGWNEGPGSGADVPLLVLVAADDAVAGEWSTTQFPMFARATGPKLMGVVAGGGHNLGPHYWHGWTTAFLLSEMTGDDAAAAAAWGDRDDENAEPFGAHPNMESAWRYDPERAGDDAATTTALEAFEWDRDDGGGGAPGPGAGGWFDDLSA